MLVMLMVFIYSVIHVLGCIIASKFIPKQRRFATSLVDMLKRLLPDEWVMVAQLVYDVNSLFLFWTLRVAHT